MSPDAWLVHQRVDAADAARLCGGAWVPVDLDFFGAATRLWVRSAEEAAEWRHFYKHHLGGGAPAVEVWLEVSGRPGASFLHSLVRQEQVERSIYVRAGGELELWSRFDAWSTIPSPLPPFQLPPLSEEVFVMNASCVRPRGWTSAILLAAPRYNGKSTVANAFVERGGTPLGDNLAVVEASSGRVLPYLAPTGIRAETVGKVPGLDRAVAAVPEHRTTISEVTGKVYLLHFDEIYDHPPASPAPIRAFIYPADHRQSGLPTRLIPLDGDEAIARACAFRARFEVDAPTHTSALERLVQSAASFELEYDLSSCDVGAVVDAIAAAVGGAP